MSETVKQQAGVEQEVTKIWNATFISVFLTNGLMYLGQQMVQPLITSYAKSLGATEVIIGMVASAFTITAILFKVISAPAIDTFNRKFILCGAMCVMGMAFLGYSMTSSVPSIFAFRLLQGSGQAFTATCCLALATDALPRDQLGQGIGIFSLAQAICHAIGPTIGKFVQGAFGFNITFLLAAVFMFAGAVCATRIKTKFVRTQKFKISLRSMIAKEAFIPTGTLFFLAMAYSLINSFLYIFAEAQGVVSDSIGLFFTIYALTLLFTRPMVGRLTDRLGTVRVVIPAMCCFAAAFLLISFSTSLWMFFVAAFVSAFGYGACQPALNTLCMRMVPKERRGAGSCTNYIGIDLGGLIGPTLAGAIATQFGYPSMWRFMLVPMACAMLIVIVNRQKIDRAGENLGR